MVAQGHAVDFDGPAFAVDDSAVLRQVGIAHTDIIIGVAFHILDAFFLIKIIHRVFMREIFIIRLSSILMVKAMRGVVRLIC